MSIKIMTRCWELELPPNEKLILLAFADHANDEGKCFPSLSRIAWKSCLSRTTVKRTVRKLKEKGLLLPIAFKTGGRSRAVTYTVCPEKGTILAPFVRKGVLPEIPLKEERGPSMTVKGSVTAAPESSGTIMEAAATVSLFGNNSLEAWTFIGAVEPFGNKPFRKLWEKFFSSRKASDSAPTVMERCGVFCQDSQISVPKRFWDLKRELEKQPETAAIHELPKWEIPS